MACCDWLVSCIGVKGTSDQQQSLIETGPFLLEFDFGAACYIVFLLRFSRVSLVQERRQPNAIDF